MKKRLIAVLFSLFIVLLAAYGTVRATSYDRAVYKAGMSEKGHFGYLIDYGRDMEEDNYEVRFAPVIAGDDSSAMSIVFLKETPFWGWILSRRVVSRPGDTSIILVYGKSSNIFSYGYEKHIVYAGNNAIKMIDSLSDVLPPNITVDIISYPDNPYYCLHFMSYDEYEIEPEELLRQKGYIR